MWHRCTHYHHDSSEGCGHTLIAHGLQKHAQLLRLHICMLIVVRCCIGLQQMQSCRVQLSAHSGNPLLRATVMSFVCEFFWYIINLCTCESQFTAQVHHNIWHVQR